MIVPWSPLSVVTWTVIWVSNCALMVKIMNPNMSCKNFGILSLLIALVFILGYKSLWLEARLMNVQIDSAFPSSTLLLGPTDGILEQNISLRSQGLFYKGLSLYLRSHSREDPVAVNIEISDLETEDLILKKQVQVENFRVDQLTDLYFTKNGQYVKLRIKMWLDSQSKSSVEIGVVQEENSTSHLMIENENKTYRLAGHFFVARDPYPLAQYSAYFGIFLFIAICIVYIAKKSLSIWPELPITGTILIALFCVRLLATFIIVPGNAPDEIGHMVIATALSWPKLLTLDEGLTYTAYPYALYNPFPYWPGALALKLGSFVDSSLNLMSQPMTGFAYSTGYLARVGMLIWTIAYLFAVKKIAELVSPKRIWFTVLLFGLIPQIVFVQSYVNTDSIGLFVSAYMIWAVHERRWSHVGIASYLALNSKLTVMPLLFFPALVFGLDYYKKPFVFVKKWLPIFGLPLLMTAPWYVWNYFYSAKKYDSFFGFSALMRLTGEVLPGAGNRVFSKEFIVTTIGSSFAAFGYMNQWLEKNYYLGWTFVILPIGFGWIVWRIFKGRNSERTFYVGMLAAVMANIFAHFHASYFNSYQAQGRYVFPAVICLMFGFANFLNDLMSRHQRFGNLAAAGIAIYLAACTIVGLKVASPDPFDMGFITQRSIRQASDTEKMPSLQNGVIVEQRFIAPEVSLKRISLAIDSLSWLKSGIIGIRILDDQDRIYFSGEKRFSELSPLGWSEWRVLMWKFPMQVGSAYRLQVIGSEIPDHSEIALRAKSKMSGNKIQKGEIVQADFAYKLFY